MYQHPHIIDTKFATHTFQKVADTMVWNIVDIKISYELIKQFKCDSYIRMIFMSDQIISSDFDYSQ